MEYLAGVAQDAITYAMQNKVTAAASVAGAAAAMAAGSALMPPPRPPVVDVRGEDDTIDQGVMAADDVSVEEVPAVFRSMQAAFKAGWSKPYDVRYRQLQALLRFIEECEEELIQALQEDLGRPVFEGLVYDVLVPKNEVKHLLHGLKRLMRGKAVSDTLITFPSKGYLRKDPYGTVLVIGTWNYPVMLCLVPIAGAIAAGNTVVLKPSVISSSCATLLGEKLPKYLDPRLVRVVGHTHERDRHMTTALLEHPWNKIFFTGSPTTGKIVYKAAAEHLTPVTLELGGKNPVFVAKDADIKLAAKRTVWGRLMNAGQQCIAPDYVLVHEDIAEAFKAACKEYLNEWYSGNADAPDKLGRIVNDRRMKVMVDLLTKYKDNVYCGGSYDAATRYVEPTVMSMEGGEEAMGEETFGPILMVMAVGSMEDAVTYVSNKPHPLTLYLFTSSSYTRELILNNTTAGGTCINGTLMQAGHASMPFGGVGASGLGRYHGDYTFDCFVHEKPVLDKTPWHDFGLLSDPFFLYQPWTDFKQGLVRLLMG